MCGKLFSLTVCGAVLGMFLSSAGAADLIGYWPLDGNPLDQSGKGYHGAAEGDVTYVDAVLGQGSDHNGSNALINCEDVPMPDAISVAFWVKPRNISQNWAGYVSKWTLDNSQRTFWLGQHATDGWLRWGIYPTGATAETFVDSGQVILANEEWTHIACTHDGNIQRIYADGAEIVASPDRNAGVVDRGGNLRFGIVASGNWFNGTLDDIQIYEDALTEGEVQAAMQGIASEKASDPVPADGAADVLRDVIPSWTAGEFAVAHNVYLGKVFADVNDASADDPLGTMVSLNQDATAYDPGVLDFGDTYHWRVDEVNGAPDRTVFKGEVWSFTVEPFSIPIEAIVASASSANAANMGPENTINASGLNDLDQHSAQGTEMWLSATGDQDIWIQYAFDQVYKLHEMWIWNSNQVIEAFVGLGVKEVTVEVSTDGENWTAVPNVPIIAQAIGAPGYAANTTIDLGGAMAQHVRINVIEGYGPLGQYGLSEVRFFYVPNFPREPEPADGAITTAVDVDLNWRTGREAAAHEVYLGTIADDLALTATVDKAGYTVTDLDYDQTYFWQIVEINEAEEPATYPGPVWRFTTPAYAVVDDFESYDDDCNRIFFAWEDGLGHNGGQDIEDCEVAPSNGNGGGSIVGNESSPFAERTLVHSGGQAMPLAYDNNFGPSETTLKLEAQDWTSSGIKSLSLFFRGSAGNSGQLYVKINDTKVSYGGDAADIAGVVWLPWIIDLSTVGANLQSVTSLTVGVDGAAAAGTLYIDDIRLYPLAPEYLTPVAPDEANLVAHYPLDGDLNDASGNGAHGTANGDLFYEAGVQGQALRLDGVDDFVDLGVPTHWPSGAAPRTLSAWALTFSVDPGWRIIVGYGSPAGGQATALVMNGTMVNGSGYGSDIFVNEFWAPDEWHHVALTYDGSMVRLYADGVELTSGARSWNTDITTARIGRQVNEAPEFWEGLVDEVRLYDKVLSLEELAWLAGKTAPVVKPF